MKRYCNNIYILFRLAKYLFLVEKSHFLCEMFTLYFFVLQNADCMGNRMDSQCETMEGCYESHIHKPGSTDVDMDMREYLLTLLRYDLFIASYNLTFLLA